MSYPSPYHPYFTGPYWEVPAFQSSKYNSTPMKEWMKRSKGNLYPTKEEKTAMMYQSGKTMSQVENWFANKRRSLKRKDQLNFSNEELNEGKEINITEESRVTEQLKEVARKLDDITSKMINKDSSAENHKKTSKSRIWSIDDILKQNSDDSSDEGK